MVKYKFSQDGEVLTIYDSYATPKNKFNKELNQIRAIHSSQPIFNRSNCSLSREWCTHNFLYMIGVCKDRTKDTDFDYPLPWYMAIAYFICGIICWPFIK